MRKNLFHLKFSSAPFFSRKLFTSRTTFMIFEWKLLFVFRIMFNKTLISLDNVWYSGFSGCKCENFETFHNPSWENLQRKSPQSQTDTTASHKVRPSSETTMKGFQEWDARSRVCGNKFRFQSGMLFKRFPSTSLLLLNPPVKKNKQFDGSFCYEIWGIDMGYVIEWNPRKHNKYFMLQRV